MPRFVLEIGTEELPPRFFPVVLPQLKADGEKMLLRARLDFGEVKVYGTPRRLALVVEDLAERQAAGTREERGPSAKVAFDAEGKPTKAALGFARRALVDPAALERRQTDQGEYVFAVIQEPELPAKDALAPLLPGLIAGLSFPKAMRWGTGKLRFGRPIRWLLALLDDQIVEFELEGLKSGRLTRGHPVLAEGLPAGRVAGMHEVNHAADYEADLHKRKVMVQPEERRLRISEQLALGSREIGAQVVEDGLLDETVCLVEWPTTAIGRFDEEFLRIPDAILIAEMRHIQSYFPLRGNDGKLLPRFIAVRDGGEDHLGIVVAGWENVLRAKLIDARFFYQEDLKRALADRVEDLRGVMFQEKLGSMYEKVERLRAAAAAAAKQAGLSDADTHALDRAALLCKADLTTEVVQELSSLQGVIGGEYARRADPPEPPHVADAIAEHYRPKSASDSTPSTTLGCLLAVADKLDTLGALFAAGIVPSGSTDPFGLRREAYGVVRIIAEAGESPDPMRRLRLSVSPIVRASLSVLHGHVELGTPADETIAAVLAFLADRLSVSLREEGVRYDLVDAALAAGVDDLGLAAQRARALQQLSSRPDFLPTVIACTRPMNIAKGFEGGEVDQSLLAEPAEVELWRAYQQVVAQADSANLLELFKLIADRLAAPIKLFFDEVLVMHEDPAIRRNRLALCWQLSHLFRRIADFTLIVQT
ncbi:MAG: glycine--tRNA ligase subunit beta [Armatimonadota bacterium]